MSDQSSLIQQVEEIYNGAEGDLWELLLGRCIHTCGWYSSQDLASKAGIIPAMEGVDICCNNGESMRFLVRNRGVRKMHGVDISKKAVERGRKICQQEGFSEDQISFTQADVTKGLTMFADNTVDFVWSEEAFGYIPDKGALIKSSARILKPGGAIAFTDWILGPNKMTDDEYKQWLEAMRVPNQGSLEIYPGLMRDAGFEVLYADDTKRLRSGIQLNIDMLEKQFKGDALRLLGNDTNAYDDTVQFFHWVLELVEKGKVIQGMFVGRKVGDVMKEKGIQSKL